jgi:MFS family permease
MSLPVLDTVERGIRRAVARNGLLFMALVFVVGLAGALLDAGLDRLVAVQFDPADPGAVEFVAPSLAVGLLSLAVAVLSLVVVIAALRVFVTDDTETVPAEAFTRRMGWAWLNSVVGAVVFGIAVALGFLAFVVPGFFLLVALAFWTVFVAVEDRNFLAAMRDSWALTRGSRLSLFALGVVTFVVTLAVSIAFGVLGVVGGPAALVFTQAASAVTTVFGLAVLATAYTTLTAESEASPESPATDTDADAPGAGTTGGI